MSGKARGLVALAAAGCALAAARPASAGPIDGSIYDPASGAPVRGAAVVLYYDVDDALAPDQRVPDAALPAGQQGQRTAGDGRYHFDAPASRRYRLAIEADRTGFAFPSGAAPATDGFAPIGRVAGDATPAAGRPTPYYLRFAISSPEDAVRGNHVPVDRLRDVLGLRLAVDRGRAAIGDALVLEAALENPTARVLTAAARRAVYLRLAIPRGFALVPGTAAGTLTVGGATRAIHPGEVRERAGSDRLLRLGPLDLPAGGAIALRLQLVVGADAERGPARIAAALVDGGGVALIDATPAALRVVADDALDLAPVVGRVWCDDDGDGEADRDEPGIHGARIYAETGARATTDRDGRWHLARLAPGAHAIKLDDASLAGGTPRGGATRRVDLGSGAPAEVDFAVACVAERVDLSHPRAEVASGATRGTTPIAPVQRTLRVTGRTGDATISIAGDPLALPRAGLTAVGPTDDLPMTPWRAALELRPTVEVPGALGRWIVRIERADGDGWVRVREVRGGAPLPERIAWDGVVDGGGGAPAGRYRAQLVAYSVGGAAEAASDLLAIAIAPNAAAAAPAPAGDETWDGALFVGAADAPRATDRLRARIAALAPRLAAGDAVEIEAHGDGAGERLAMVARTQREADLVARLLAEAGAKAKLRARGRGSLEPRVEGTSASARAQNRRVVIKVTSAAPAAVAPAAAVALTVPPDVRIDGRSIALEPDGRFAADVAPRGEAVFVDVRGPRGGRGAIAVPVGLGAPPGPFAPPIRAVAVRGEPAAGRIELGDRVLPTELFAVDLAAARPTVEGRLVAGRRLLDPPLELRPSLPRGLTPTRWRVVIRDGAGAAIGRLAGDGAPPAAIAWDGRGGGRDVPPGGRYAATLELDVAAGDTAISPPVGFEIDAAVAGPALAVPLFDGRTQPTARLRNWLSTQVAAARGRPLSLALTLRTSAEASEIDRKLFRAAREAALRRYLVRLGLSADRLILTVVASDAAPSDRIAVGAPAAAAVAAPPPAVRINGDEIGLVDGRFATDVAVPAGGAGLVDVVGPGGHRALARALADAAPGWVGAAAPRPPPAAAPFAARPGLVAYLPPAGVVLGRRELAVRGEVGPGERVTINGRLVAIEAGRFVALIDLPVGPSQILIDVDGPAGRGRLRWPVQVDDHEVVAVALGDAAFGTAHLDDGFAADGATPPGLDDRLELGPFALAGRIAGFAQARWHDVLGHDDVGVTIQADSARRGDAGFFAELDDPRQAPPIFGDAGDEARLAEARGPLYLRIDADASNLTVGSVRADLTAGELFRYQRTGDGVALAVDRAVGGPRVRAHGFVTDDGMLGAGGSALGGVARDVVLLRATGGSLYHARHGQVAEGSEVLTVVVRDRDSGLPLERRRLARDADYEIDYPTGRILLRAPLASTARADRLIDGLGASATPLAGHPVYLQVDYQHHGGTPGERAGGGTLHGDVGPVSLGVGAVAEQRADGDYSLYGADAAVRLGARSRIAAEVASSHRLDAGVGLSVDGGMSYGALDAPIEALGAERRLGWRATVELALADLAPVREELATRVALYAQDLDRGFGAADLLAEQGRLKLGGQIVQPLAVAGTLALRHDTQRVALDGPAGVPVAERAGYLTTLGWSIERGRWRHAVELAHQRQTSERPAPTGAAIDVSRAGGAASTSFALTPELRVRLGQEVLRALTDGDPILHPVTGAGRGDEPLAGVTTSVGGELRLLEDLALTADYRQRWNGDSGAELGLRSGLGYGGQVYVAERIAGQDGRVATTTVVGADERLGATGRSYGEYQLEHGTGGRRERAVLGLGRRFRPLRGLGVALGFEHQQTLGGYLPDGTPLGDHARHVVHVSGEYLALAALKLVALAELRFDRGLAVDGGAPITAATAALDHGGPVAGAPLLLPEGERTQLLAGLGADWRVVEPLTLFGRLRVARTIAGETMLEDAWLVQREREATIGVALRAPTAGWGALARYSYLLDRRPALEPGGGAEQRSHVGALLPWVELPWRLVLSAKLALKSTRAEAAPVGDDRAGSALVRAGLGLVRLGVRLGGGADVTAEGRGLRLWRPAGRELRAGALLEAGYTVAGHLRFAAGYNFSHFADDELGDLERDAHGVFARITGTY